VIPGVQVRVRPNYHDEKKEYELQRVTRDNREKDAVAGVFRLEAQGAPAVGHPAVFVESAATAHLVGVAVLGPPAEA
jgi:hypothetical protein